MPDLSTLASPAAIADPVKLPAVAKAAPAEGRVLVRSGRTLVFNRVAKTGSQSITELLMKLRGKNGIQPKVLIHEVELLMEPPEKVAEFVGQVDARTAPTAWVKHYNFVDFERYGAGWTPTYINIVRDPVERVRMRNLT